MTRIDQLDPAARDGLPDAPARARDLFGPQLALAQTYVRRLADVGITHGLLGPREVPRLWERHVVNSALLTELVPAAVRVVDVGSGAGLPGLAMAIRRPDLHVDLVEPMLRRVHFLTDTVTSLGLDDRVRVVRGRAEDRATREIVGGAAWVVARAVAPLPRLVEWCLPLLEPGGTLLALKGSTARQELVDSSSVLARLGAGHTSVQALGDAGDDQTWVVSVQRAAGSPTSRRKRS